MKPYYLCVLLASCSLPFSSTDFVVSKGLSPRKQKQKIAALQRKLESAEQEQSKILEEVYLLKQEMQLAQIDLIQRQIDDLELEVYKYRDTPELLTKKLPQDVSSLFLSEREILYQLIQQGPSPTSFDAQVVLDQILRMITTLKDAS